MIAALARSSALNNMLLYGIALLCLRGASLITLPVMTYYLSVEQIGQLELISVTQIFFALFVSLAMHENLYRFIAINPQPEQQKKMTSELYSTSLLLSGLIIAFIGGVYWLLLQENVLTISASFITPTQMLLMTSVLLIQGALEISLAWLRLQNQALAFFKISVFCSLIQVSLILGIVQLYPTVTAVLAVGVISAFLQLFILHIYNRFQFALLSCQKLSQYLRYCLPIMWSALIAFGLNGGERWLLVNAGNVELLAQYAIALKFALAVGILLQPFHMWWMPKRFEYWQNQGAASAARFTQFGLVYAALLTVLVAWLGKLFIAIALPDEYQLATQLVSVAVLAMLFKEVAELVNIGLLKAQKTQTLLRINLLITGLALSLLAWSIWAQPQYALWIVAIGVVVAQWLRATVIFIYSQQANALPYHASTLCGFMLLAIVFSLTPWFVESLFLAIAMLAIELVILLVFAQRFGLVQIPLRKVRHLILRLCA